MRKVAIAFLLRSSPSRASIVKRDPAFFLSSRPLATRLGKYAFDGESAFVGEVGALSEPSMGASKAMEKKAPRLKKGKIGSCEQDLRRAEGLLHAEISTVRAKTRAKASERRTKITVDAHAEGSAHVVAPEKATELIEIGVVEAGNVINAVLGNTEELASCAKENANRISEHQDLTEIIAKLNLNTYKHASRWENTARKLLDYGIPLAHITAMLGRCKKLHCSLPWVDSTLKNFALLGMSHQNMGKVIARLPTILNVTDSMFQRKIEFWESIGINRYALGKILPFTVMAITKSLAVLRQNNAFWEDYMKDIHTNAVCIMMSKNSQLLTYSSQEQLQEKLTWLEAQSFDKEWLLDRPSVLNMSMSALISKAEVLARLGILDARRRARVLFLVPRVRISKLEARFNNLLTAGFSSDQVITIISRCPMVLARTEDHINMKINYAVKVMNFSLDVIVLSPGLWNHSLEKRIKYRYEVIKRLQTLAALRHDLSLGYMICMSNADFNRRFLERFQDVVKQTDALSG